MTSRTCAVPGRNHRPRSLDNTPAGRPHFLCIVVTMAVLAAMPAWAQDAAAGAEDKKTEDAAAGAEDKKTEDAASTPETPAAEENTAAEPDIMDRLEKLEQRSEAMAKENEDLKARVAKQEEAELDTRVETLEAAGLERMQDEDKKLKVYGFADVQWYKFFYKDTTRYEGQLNDNNSFAAGHWNLFLEKRADDHFRFLGEVAFLFQPYGDEISYDGTDFFTGEETYYERAYTQSLDWVDASIFDWGGISIKRLWIEYKLSDVFGIRAGNFLTPFGIWNVDHASTVVIPAHRPFIITSALLPETQTGLDIFGRFFPSDSTTIDYALTLTNGRGPTAKLFDLDENKAAGLSLAFTYDGPFSLSLGTYLFIGKYTDLRRSLNADAQYLWNYEAEVTNNYLEMTMSFHLKLEWEGVLLQGEYVQGVGRYKGGVRPIWEEPTDTDPGAFGADFQQYAGYALVAYRLPFEAINLTPFFIFEHQRPPDGTILPRGNNFGGGLNWRITPSVVWKVEVLIHRETEDFWAMPKEMNHYGNVYSQLAISY